jgi:ABC-type multidrug transport system fused ATPase/permease subunit
MFRMILESDKILLLFVLLQILFSTTLPFIGIFLIKHSVDMLTSGTNYFTYFPRIMFLLSSLLIGNFLQTIVSHNVEVRINIFGMILFIKIFNKSMELDYEMLLDKSFMEKRELALKGIDQARFNGMVRSFMSFTSSLLIIAGIVVVLSRIEFWILGMVLAIVILNARATTIRKSVERSVSIENVPYVRKIQYFMSLDGDSAFGKEIRLYDMLDALNGIFAKLQKASLIFVKRLLGLNTKGLLLYHTCGFALNSVIYGYLGYKLLVPRLISVGDFSMYLNAITTFNTSIQEMITAYIDISNNGEYLKDYFDYMAITSRYDNKGRDIPATGEFAFTFENVSFRYPLSNRIGPEKHQFCPKEQRTASRRGGKRRGQDHTHQTAHAAL